MAGKLRPLDCQPASNFDPLARRGLPVALVSPEVARIAETRRARVAWSSSRLLNRQVADARLSTGVESPRAAVAPSAHDSDRFRSEKYP
jgi:hypothetical protein